MVRAPGWVAALGVTAASLQRHSLAEAAAAPGILSNLTATAADGGTEVYPAAPARWNAWHPENGRCPRGSRWRCNCPVPPGPESAAAAGPMVAAPAIGHKGLGLACSVSTLPPAPPRVSAVLLARRGDCAFHEKASAAQEAGYCGLLVANARAGPPHPYYGQLELPDMTAQSTGAISGIPDDQVGLPAWLLTKDTGDELFAQLRRGSVRVEVRDDVPKPPLGSGQEDEFGLREHHYE
uniref:PA domain-containing protein n=1 Tax=Alexandrium monilatum TaxID=311494 RepID=A0A7S4SG55_9DINO|mmetsp:Transcript_86076/g.256828  ORF Transcript_86076/g.256828 Transcript_86076/m.256828 type:complete len:237 (+) Transcript_86076:54-764(+)